MMSHELYFIKNNDHFMSTLSYITRVTSITHHIKHFIVIELKSINIRKLIQIPNDTKKGAIMSTKYHTPYTYILYPNRSVCIEVFEVPSDPSSHE